MPCQVVSATVHSSTVHTNVASCFGVFSFDVPCNISFKSKLLSTQHAAKVSTDLHVPNVTSWVKFSLKIELSR